MTEYYLQLASYGLEIFEKFWAVDEGIAHQGFIPSEIGTIRAASGKDILTTLQDNFGGAEFHLLQLGPGEYYPRMARPESTSPDRRLGKNPDQNRSALNARTTSTGQLHALIQQLQEICRVVHPIDQNLDAFGHEIRNLLIIACTEVEAQWKSILVANGQKPQNRRDYVKLAPVMKLNKYRVALPWYPWIEPIAPFERWVPTLRNKKQDLPWYDAYNNVKHDREENFSKSKLRHAIESLTACFVMLCAQYGLDFVRSGEEARDVFFRLIEWPTWEPSEIYVPSFGAKMLPRHYPFES